MAFEAFPQDCVDAFNDAGLFYVHENGKLRSPPGLGPKSHPASSAVSSSGLPRPAPFYIGESYAPEGPTCFVPRSLFQQTLNFVALNLWRVESLVGFPDIVGEQLFQAAAAMGVFSNKQLRISSLKLFVDAYGSQVLSVLDIHESTKMVDEYLTELMLFSSLSELDLSGCDLEADHDVWPHIGSMPCLQRLGLSKTGLSDHIMQKLTTPLRLMNRGPRGIQVLDLSGNPKVTDRSNRFLRVFLDLRALDISACCFSTHGIKEAQSLLGLTLLTTDQLDDHQWDVFSRPLQTQGWARGIIQEWAESSKARNQEKALPQGCPRARKFYSSSSSRLGFLDVTKSAPSPVSITSQPCNRLVKDCALTEKCSHSLCESGCRGVKLGGKACRSKDIDPKGAVQGKQSDKKSFVETDVGKRQALSLEDEDAGLMVEFTHRSDFHSRHIATEKDDPKPDVRVSGWSATHWAANVAQRNGKPKLKIRVKRKRKREEVENVATVAKDGEESELLKSYLSVRQEGAGEAGEGGRRPRLLRAMDSTHW